ncbi:MAG: phenylalanine--tRNA ligase subunit beta [Candidatus Moranbacteria bacterium]|nr:phenylalanine--tRNA ligase subunit beta [Candidatus Moranbacteria bacterium]
MKYSVSWLNELAHTQLSAEEMAELFTRYSFEVDGIEKIQSIPSGVVVGKILDVAPHPRADKLSLTKVTIDPNEKDVLSIVCGAKNIASGDKVAVATLGTKLGKDILIQEAVIRGEISQGMLCAQDELGIGDDHSGIFHVNENVSLGTSLCDLYGEGDECIELDILASRGRDALSHIGIARELTIFCKTKLSFDFSLYEKITTSPKSEKDMVIDIEDSTQCHRYRGALIQGLDNEKETPRWMKDRLTLCGVSSINLATDITNYVMLETGQPLHAFDYDSVKEGNGNVYVTVRNAKAGETLEILDGRNLTFCKEDIVVAGRKKIIALAGVMGGKESATQKTSTSIFLESAWFNPISIRKTRKYHKIDTQSAYRFERDVDPCGVTIAMERALELFRSIGGAHVVFQDEKYLQKAESFEVDISLKEIHSLLGVTPSCEEVKEILLALSFGVTEEGDDFHISISSFRKDVQTKQDVIEEIGRIYGYDRIPSIALVTKMQCTQKSSREKVDGLVKKMLLGVGFDEVLTYSFYGKRALETFFLDEQMHFSLSNPLNPQLAFFRSKILPNMLSITKENSKRFDNVNIFEMGKVYEREEDGSVKEYSRLGIISSQTKKGNKGEILFRLKGAIENILFSLFGQYPDVSPIEFEKGLEYFHRSQSMDISLDGVLIGFLGTLHPSIPKQMKLPEQTAIASLDRDALAYLFERGSRYYVPLERFPSVFRDISMKVPYETTAKQVEESIREIISKEHLRSLELFDVFEKEEEKNFAYHLEFNSNDRTLTGKEIDDIIERVFEKLISLGIEIRK